MEFIDDRNKNESGANYGELQISKLSVNVITIAARTRLATNCLRTTLKLMEEIRELLESSLEE